MRVIWAVALLTFKEGLRRRILFGVVVSAFLFMGFAVLISGLYMRDILKIMLDLCLSAVNVSGLLVPFFIGITLLSGDLEQKTVYTLLSRQLSRAQYILGKFFGFGMLTTTVMAILTVASFLTIWASTYIYPSYFFETFSPSSVLVSTLMGLLSVLVLNSAMILWCCVTTSSFLATLLTLATYIIGQTVEDIVRFVALDLEGVDISPLTEKTAQVAMYVFPNFAAFDFKQYAAHGLPVPLFEIVILCLYGPAYILVMLLLAIVIFQRRDLS